MVLFPTHSFLGGLIPPRFKSFIPFYQLLSFWYVLSLRENRLTEINQLIKTDYSEEGEGELHNRGELQLRFH